MGGLNVADYCKAGLVAIRENRILLCRKKHTTSLLILPGGVMEEGETPEDCLQREVREELGEVALTGVHFLGRYLSPAAVPGKTVQIELFQGELTGTPRPESEIKELIWFGPGDDPAQLAPSLRDLILPDLIRRGILPVAVLPNAIQ